MTVRRGLWMVVLLGACGGDDGVAGVDAVVDTGKGDDPHPDTSSPGEVHDSAPTGDTVAPDSSDPLDTSAAPDTPDMPDTSDVSDTTAADVLPPPPEPVVDGLVRRVDPLFWANMDDFVFNHARPAGVGLYVAINNANHFSQRPHRAWGAELIRHPDSFFDNVLGPFVERYADALWAIDCMNEPEAMVQGPDGNYAAWGVTWDEMRAYLAGCAAVVKARGGGRVPVSAGSGWHDWHNLEKGYYDGLGFDFLDAHVYLDTWNLPPAASLASIPVVIGECGQKTERWDDALQLAATRACFTQAASGGYHAALSWYYDYAGSVNHLAHKNADGTWRPVGALFAAHDGTGSGPMRTGLNLAWLGGAYDHDFAPNPLHPEWGVSYDAQAVAAIVADYATTGIGIMRLWAFEGQEGMPYHALHADFEEDFHGFVPIDRASASLTFEPYAAPGTDGAYRLRAGIVTTQPGWHGVERTFTSDMPLNLAVMRSWSYVASQDLGVARGVHLYFTVEVDGPGGVSLVTYQTREAGQLWLEPGASGAATVPLDAAGFEAHWALASAPSVGVARPAAATLERVRAIGVRVYLEGPSNGAFTVDTLRIAGRP